MEYDFNGSLWTDRSVQQVSHHLTLMHRVQIGGSCVSTGLSVITGEAPETIRAQVNTQSPMSWSDYLHPHGWKLAYCNTDLRRLSHYAEELLQWDDLFVVCTYSPDDPARIGDEPNEDGWICSSHFMLLHRDQVFDTRYRSPIELTAHPDPLNTWLMGSFAGA